MGLEPQKKKPHLLRLRFAASSTTTTRLGRLTPWAFALASVLALGAGCGGKSKGLEPLPLPAEGSGSGEGSAEPAAPAPPPAPDQDIDSKDILARAEITEDVEVKHVLLAWGALAEAYGGKLDPRAANRSNADAAKLALQLAEQLRAKPDDIDALIQQHSEDPGSLSGDAYRVASDSPFVTEFKNLALRLKEKEVGLVRTHFGYHVVERVPPPPPDPLESAAILARAANAGPVHVRHIAFSWKDAPVAKQREVDPRAKDRSKEDADKLATETLAKVKKGADIVKLMKELSEDPGTAPNGRSYSIDEKSGVPPSFKKLALRLKLGEAGLVKTEFGWHVVKRVPPPPPDKLDSKAILARKKVAEKVTVKHILLGWTEINAGDERGKTRTRAELEALVKKTVAALKKGDPIEPLMKELSEDPGSKEGQPYEVTAETPLVKPFKDLSLRLNPDEVGVVKTDFGIHIIKRVSDIAPVSEPPAPTPPAGN